MQLIEIKAIKKNFGSKKKLATVIRGVDLFIDRGETLGIVGESGCGKTTLGRMVAGLIKPTSGEMIFDGHDILQKSHREQARGRIQMVFQNPVQSLNRQLSVGDQVAEPFRLLGGLGKSLAFERARLALDRVELEDKYFDRKPSQMSGGQLQRVALARALASKPDLIVLDEPTASLDKTIHAIIISLLLDVQQEFGVSYLFITHDLTLVRSISQRVAVMYLGRIVELATADELFKNPLHPYTRALLSAAPTFGKQIHRERITLKGETPSAKAIPFGCSLQDRCPLVHDRCRSEVPRLVEVNQGHQVECFAVNPGV
ncbi:MAG: ATP-binding cassette domain-containing protein [Acidimicrobiaceae bacterium]|nr:ATP-binding cassette domain-containing protein [Acidimicrobiaceae bacterium]